GETVVRIGVEQVLLVVLRVRPGEGRIEPVVAGYERAHGATDLRQQRGLVGFCRQQDVDVVDEPPERCGQLVVCHGSPPSGLAAPYCARSPTIRSTLRFPR